MESKKTKVIFELDSDVEKDEYFLTIDGATFIFSKEELIELRELLKDL